MKTIQNSKNVAHLWAHKAQSEAKTSNGNFYFQGDTIFSYGPHFPIARHVTNKHGQPAILFTTETYSNTTAKHLSYTAGAIPFGVPVFRVQHPRNDPDLEMWKDLERTTIKLWEKQTKARDNKRAYLKQYDNAIDQANSFAERFNIKRHLDNHPAYQEELAKAETYDIKAQERKAIREAKRERDWAIQRAQREKEFAEKLSAWLNGESVSLPYTGNRKAYLRLRPTDPETTETSLGADVPTKHILTCLPFVLERIKTGQPWSKNGHTIHLGHYEIDSITADGELRAGCHLFEKSEIERFAAILQK